MFDNKKLGAYIQFLRKSRGMTQSRLAETLGLSPQAVSNWERGESMPDIALLTQIARALGTTVDRILSAAEDFDPERYKTLLEGTPDPPQEAEAPNEPDVQNEADSKEEPPKEDQHTQFGENLGELIRNSVMGALSGLSGLSEKLRPKFEMLNEELEDVIEEAVEGIEDAMKTSRKADRVIHINLRSKKRENGPDGDKWRDIVAMAPFASEEMLDALVRDLDPGTDHHRIVELAPFLSDKTVDMLVTKALASGGDMRFLMEIAPFCGSLDKILLESGASFTIKELLPLAPFLDEETIDTLIQRRL